MVENEEQIEGFTRDQLRRGSTMKTADYAASYLDLRFSVFPLVARTKKPATENGFKDASNSPKQKEIWTSSSDFNIGIATGEMSGISVIDVDVKSGGIASFEKLKTDHGLNANTLTVKTPGGGLHLYYRDKLGIKGAIGILPGIDIRSNGGYVAAPPSVHPNGGTYIFDEIDFSVARTVDIQNMLAPFPHELIGKLRSKSKKVIKHSDSVVGGRIPDGRRFESLRSMLGALKAKGISQLNARKILHDENDNRCVPPLPRDEVDRIVDGIFRLNDRSLLIAAAHTDLGNAERFTEFVDQDAVFVTSMNKWHRYDGTRYVVDDGSQATAICKSMLRVAQNLTNEIADEAIKTKIVKHLKSSESLAKIRAMTALAAEGDLRLPPDALDSDPFLFNVQNGTIDLRNGKLQPHDRKDRISKIANVLYDSSAARNRFEQFLDEIFCGDRDLIRYVQKAIGYSLSGDTTEQVLFIFAGGGRNGKSTFIALMEQLVGEYGRAANIATFTLKQGDQIRNDLARLHDARVVTSVEIQEGKFLDESIIKQVTGGDRVTARFLFKELFEYVPKWKLFLAVNHLPHITGGDTGIWRRIRVIPFKASFEGQKDDRDLKQKLLAEMSGILNWAIEGHALWRREGLVPPAQLTDAVSQYQESEDVLAGFFEKHIEVSERFSIDFAEVFERYCSYQKELGQRTATQKQFSQKLTIKGFERSRSSGGKVVFKGLRAKPIPFSNF